MIKLTGYGAAGKQVKFAERFKSSRYIGNICNSSGNTGERYTKEMVDLAVFNKETNKRNFLKKIVNNFKALYYANKK